MEVDYPSMDEVKESAAAPLLPLHQGDEEKISDFADESADGQQQI